MKKTLKFNNDEEIEIAINALCLYSHDLEEQANGDKPIMERSKKAFELARRLYKK